MSARWNKDTLNISERLLNAIYTSALLVISEVPQLDQQMEAMRDFIRKPEADTDTHDTDDLIKLCGVERAEAALTAASAMACNFALPSHKFNKHGTVLLV